MLATACRNDTFHGYHSKMWPIRREMAPVTSVIVVGSGGGGGQASSYALI